MKYLVETALLTHGLRSVSNEEIKKTWTLEDENIVWISEGNIQMGNIDAYLEFRKKAESLIRIDGEILEHALQEGISGALTASGTMRVCEKMNVPIAVTCGMGGIGDIKGEELCPDLPVLTTFQGTLISAGPKDMLDRAATVDWLTNRGVKVVGAWREICTGYVFRGDEVKLQGVYQKEQQDLKRPTLIINEIPEEKRVLDRTILEAAIREGKCAEKEGRYYHPAANGKIDELTGGYSSYIQLECLLENAKLAAEIEI